MFRDEKRELRQEPNFPAFLRFPSASLLICLPRLPVSSPERRIFVFIWIGANVVNADSDNRLKNFYKICGFGFNRLILNNNQRISFFPFGNIISILIISQLIYRSRNCYRIKDYYLKSLYLKKVARCSVSGRKVMALLFIKITYLNITISF